MMLNREENNMIDDLITKLGYKELIKMLVQELKNCDAELYYKSEIEERTDSLKSIHEYCMKNIKDGQGTLPEYSHISKYVHLLGPDLIIQKLIRETPDYDKILDDLRASYDGLHNDCYRCTYSLCCSRTSIKKCDGKCTVDYVNEVIE